MCLSLYCAVVSHETTTYQSGHPRCPPFDISLAFTYGAPNHTNTRLRNTLAVLTLLLFTFVCAALYQGFARSGDYCEPLVDTFFFNAMTPMPHSFGAAQAA